MLKEPMTSPIQPSSLTDMELLRFTEEFASNGTMPQTFQQELLKRYVAVFDKIKDGDLVEPDNTNEELEEQIESLECQVYDLEREVDRLTDELDALKEQPNQ